MNVPEEQQTKVMDQEDEEDTEMVAIQPVQEAEDAELFKEFIAKLREEKRQAKLAGRYVERRRAAGEQVHYNSINTNCLIGAGLSPGHRGTYGSEGV